MAPAFVQSNDATLTGAGNFASQTLAYSSNTTAGNMLITLVCWFKGASADITVSVTDSQGNKWFPVPRRQSPASLEYMQIWYAPNCKGGANTVTYTFTGSGGASFIGAFVSEYSGVNALDNYDNETDGVTAHTSGTGTAVISSFGAVNGVAQAAATHDSTELVINYGQSSNYSNWTVSAPWTLRSTATARQMGFADQLAGNGSYFGSLTLNASANWSVGCVTFYQKDSSQFVQETDHDDGANVLVATDVMSYASPNTQGNLLFLNYVFLGGPSGADVSISSVVDTLGNTWIPLPRVVVDNVDHGNGKTFAQAWYVLGCKGGANTTTVSFSGLGARFIGASISEWTGVNALDGFAQQAVQSATPASPSLITTGVDLLIGYATTEDGFVTFTPGSGYTSRTAQVRSVWLQSQFNAPVGTYASSLSGNGGLTGHTNMFSAGIAAFKNGALAYSVPDCRAATSTTPNSSRNVQGTFTYDVQKIDSRTAGAPIDSRIAGAPIDSRVANIIPQNSRTPGTFGPGE